MDIETNTTELLIKLNECKKHIDMIESFIIKNIQKKEIKPKLESISEEETTNEPSISNVKMEITESQPQMTQVELNEDECFIYPQPPQEQQQEQSQYDIELNKYVDKFFESFNITQPEKEKKEKTEKTEKKKEKDIKTSSYSSSHRSKYDDYDRKRKYEDDDDNYYQSKRKYEDKFEKTKYTYDDDEELHGNDIYGTHSDYLVNKEGILKYKLNCPYGTKCSSSGCIKNHKELIISNKKVIFNKYPTKELFSDGNAPYYFKKNCCFGDKCIKFKQNECDFNHYPLVKVKY